jgi:signal transduction histidine kinase
MALAKRLLSPAMERTSSGGISNMTAQPNNIAQARIDALSEAISAVTSELDLGRILHHIAEISARLVNARFAALGVPNESGGLKSFFTYGMTDKQVAHMDHLPLGMGLLGALLTSPNPIRLANMHQDSRSAGFCANHPKMTSFLGVPVISKGIHLGNLYLCDRLDAQPFTEDDERLITLLAGHAAIAIENAMLSDKLRQLAIVEERDRIAMELHDGIIQQIYALGIKLEIARTTSDLSTEIDTQIRAATQGLNGVIEDLHRYIQDLKSGVSLAVRLQDQLEEVAAVFRSVSNARLVMEVRRGFGALTEERLHAIVQVAREALSNIVRHAQAQNVHLELREDDQGLHLQITDDGSGFDVVSHRSSGRGLNNMRQRAERMGGQLSVESYIGRGTTVTLHLPASQ